MNYGKKSAQNRIQKLSGKHTKAKKKFRVTFLKSLLICMLSVGIVVLAGGAFYIKYLIDQCPDIEDVNISPTGFKTTVLDSDGNEIETLAASGSNREYITLDHIPKDLQHAFVAIEDERFYKHHGVDPRGIARAGFQAILTGGGSLQGASTITQQLLKNNYFTGWTEEDTLLDSVNRKIQEQYLAIQLERVSDKDTILENYLNTINLGQNTLGVQAASERYFNKAASELTLSECATIAAITQNPSRYNPISNPDKNAERRKRVLDNMLEQGYISQKEYDKAMDDDVYEHIQVANAVNQGASSTSYFVDALTDQVIDDLIDQKGYSETQAYQKLYSGGLTILSTQNTAFQAICDEELNRESNYGMDVKYSFSYRLTVTKADGSYKNYSDQTLLSYYQASNPSYDINYSSPEEAAAVIEKYKSEIMEEGDSIAEGGEALTYTLQPQTAVTVIDQHTGAVVALIGGRGDKTASKTLNRATGITRQPGSTFKIVAAYAAALDAGGMTLATVEDDAPMTYADGTSLRNYDNSYRGYTTLREAIRESINVVTVRALTDIGTGLGFEYAQDLGISTLESGDNNQSLALGGITHGVTNLELTSAYATIADGGTYHKPYFYTQILDHNGNVLLDNTQNLTREVLKPTTAWLLTSAMEDVMNYGTGTPANFEGMSLAGKSGTTTKNRDTLFAGFSPYYTCVVWGGYDDNTPQSRTIYSKKLWKACMQRIHEGLPDQGFPQPSGIVRAEVCRKSGKLAVPGLCDCDPRGSMIYSEYFAENTVPTEYCDRHIAFNICNESGMISSEYCPEGSVARYIYILGGSPNAADAPYLLPESLLNESNSCNVHVFPPKNDSSTESNRKPHQNSNDGTQPGDQPQESDNTTTAPDAPAQGGGAQGQP